MNAIKKSTKKGAAQAMVEFAIALPILLAIVYGVLETGRFLFLYSTVVTASRQAVRYGTATGEDGAGVLRYQDCTGIRAAAQAAAYLGQLDSITMKYDTGPATTEFPHCENLADAEDTDFDPSSQNTSRLVVTVTEEFVPLVPGFVQYIQRDITATSARTIINSVAIYVTAPAGGGGDLTLAISATTPSGYNPITVTYLVTNTGDVDADTPITITTDKGSWSCAGEPAALTAMGGSFSCTGSYTPTLTDYDTGYFTITATADADGLSASDTETVTLTQSPALALDKWADTEASAVNGHTVNYFYDLTNTGNVTLGPPYSITDSQINSNAITCPSSGNIIPGASVQCTASHNITGGDINAGSIVNTATGTAYSVTTTPQSVTSNSDTWTVYTPALYLTITTSTSSVNTVGQAITYTYKLTNNTNGNLRSPYSVTDSFATGITCPAGPATLVAGDHVNCTGTHSVTQAELDAGTALSGTATAQARKATGSQFETSNTVNTNVTVTQSPALTLAVSVSPNPATTLQTVTYTYTLTNNGNVTLSPTFAITDNKASGITCTNPAVAIAPGGTKTCTGTRALVQSDLDDGSVTNTATATAALGAGTVTSNSASTTLTTYVGARLTLTISANPNPATGSGQIVTFTYTLRNTGSVVLTSPYSVLSTLTGSADCSSALGTIPIGGSVTCIGFYTTAPADVGGSITDSAIASALNGAATVTSNNATLTVPVNP